ncbi:chemotaxis protein CheY [Streptomyces eurocidicus]|uniref:Chemotaxis protein CheY n=1 Tax=Streptomyces eurocidicus TaxID=66423 RepID=A0A2N8NQ24_STREU|nr:response regulator transcription factor [Streptomyces eurocidicus]MBB5122357.1 two-component system nitrate/nitrite response regulator NarL [Streptomyces eurocidicus]MBF6051641.1 response regulator [Streptomyces eurocidicus]PNE30868.1 chemotaxis protein CheY [Streptomyces eurocidicus]
MTDSGARVTVVVADDHPVYREGIARGLQLSGRIDVLAEVGDGAEALELIRELTPQVALIDYRIPTMDGIAVVHALARDHLPTRALLLSATTDAAVVYRAVQEGAAGYLAKDAKRSEIVDAVLKVAAGKQVVSEDLAGGLVDEIRMRADRDPAVLSERERQVLRGFSEGKSIPQLASELYLGASTVKTHTQRLYEKLGVSDRAAAVAEAMRRGLLE